MAIYDDASEEVVATLDEISEVDVHYEKLQESFSSGPNQSFQQRIKHLRQLQRLVNDNEALLSAALKADLNQDDPTPHLVDCKRETDFMISNLSSLMSRQSVTSQMSVVNFPCSAALVPQPLGVVLIIGTWNYPFHSALGPLAGALAAGNCVVVKPGSLARNSSKLMAELVKKYFDPSVVCCIEGGKEITAPLLTKRWDHVFFTGGSGLGKIVMSAAAKHLTPVTLELGGKNPVIVAASADVALAARRIAWGKWASNAGQVCIAPDHVFVHADIADAFLHAMKEMIEQFFPRGPLEDTGYCRIVSKAHTARLATICESDKAFTVLGGETDVESKYVSPTILDFGSDLVAFESSASMQSEIFGPILPVVRFSDVDCVERLVKKRTRLAQPLSFYVFSSESKRSVTDRWVSTCASGAVVVNDCGIHIVEEHLPFGGVGCSGMGAYHGKKTFDLFTHYKPVLWKSGWLDIPMRYPPGSVWRRRVVSLLLWLARKNVTPLRVGKTLLVFALLYKIVT